MPPKPHGFGAHADHEGELRVVQAVLGHVGCESHAPNVQRYVGLVKDILLDAVRLFVGQPAAVDDDINSAHEARRLFAMALREARMRYGRESGQGEITQKVFAQMLGISGERPEERYRLYESAKREPPLWILSAVRRVTGYSLDDLIAQLPPGRRLELRHRLERAPNEPKTQDAACVVPVLRRTQP